MGALTVFLQKANHYTTFYVDADSDGEDDNDADDDDNDADDTMTRIRWAR